ncbi:hypothetical protein OS493_005389 [Desmophyllum pertusum]|uniref:Fibroblast growth factor n=1 Tax=Desmophyllum pertusum TaxID=174260 RepID=A0A9W9YSA3_9CNID|nr:hypothetical protein OS493_005389 [Desmophyllum pertusum]
MKYSTTVLFWSALAVVIFTRTLIPLADAASITKRQVGVSNTRLVRLHSTNSGFFLRINGSKVDSLGSKTEKSAKLELVTTKLKGSVGVRIRSVTENSYLCVNSAGILTVEMHGDILDRCVFTEDIYSSGHTTFQSMYNSSWYLGFKRNGKAKQPHNTTNAQKAARFLRYF